MAGFGDVFSQVHNWVDPRRNTLAGLGAGLLSGNPGAGVQAGIQADNAYAVQQKAEAEREAQIAEQNRLKSKYATLFQQYGQPEWAQAVGDGLVTPGEAWTQWMQGKQPAAPIKGIEINGRLVNPVTGEEMGNFSDPPKPPAPPSGYRDNGDGTLSFIPGGPADPAMASVKPPTDQDVRMRKLTEVVQPDIDLLNTKTADGRTVYDALGDLGNQAWNGVDVFGAKPFYGATSPEYQQAQAALANIAQSYLYAISGQAAPAGEVAKIVDSVTPKPFESADAIKTKKRRLQTYVEAIKLSKFDAAGLGGGGSGPTTYTYNPATGELE